MDSEHWADELLFARGRGLRRLSDESCHPDLEQTLVLLVEGLVLLRFEGSLNWEAILHWPGVSPVDLESIPQHSH